MLVLFLLPFLTFQHRVVGNYHTLFDNNESIYFRDWFSEVDFSKYEKLTVYLTENITLNSNEFPFDGYHQIQRDYKKSYIELITDDDITDPIELTISVPSIEDRDHFQYVHFDRIKIRFVGKGQNIQAENVSLTASEIVFGPKCETLTNVSQIQRQFVDLNVIYFESSISCLNIFTKINFVMIYLIDNEIEDRYQHVPSLIQRLQFPEGNMIRYDFYNSANVSFSTTSKSSSEGKRIMELSFQYTKLLFFIPTIYNYTNSLSFHMKTRATEFLCQGDYEYDAKYPHKFILSLNSTKLSLLPGSYFENHGFKYRDSGGSLELHNKNIAKEICLGQGTVFIPFISEVKCDTFIFQTYEKVEGALKLVCDVLMLQTGIVISKTGEIEIVVNDKVIQNTVEQCLITGTLVFNAHSENQEMLQLNNKSSLLTSPYENTYYNGRKEIAVFQLMKYYEKKIKKNKTVKYDKFDNINDENLIIINGEKINLDKFNNEDISLEVNKITKIDLSNYYSEINNEKNKEIEENIKNSEEKIAEKEEKVENAINMMDTKTVENIGNIESDGNVKKDLNFRNAEKDVNIESAEELDEKISDLVFGHTLCATKIIFRGSPLFSVCAEDDLEPSQIQPLLASILPFEGSATLHINKIDYSSPFNVMNNFFPILYSSSLIRDEQISLFSMLSTSTSASSTASASSSFEDFFLLNRSNTSTSIGFTLKKEFYSSLYSFCFPEDICTFNIYDKNPKLVNYSCSGDDWISSLPMDNGIDSLHFSFFNSTDLDLRIIEFWKRKDIKYKKVHFSVRSGVTVTITSTQEDWDNFEEFIFDGTGKFILIKAESAVLMDNNQGDDKNHDSDKNYIINENNENFISNMNNADDNNIKYGNNINKNIRQDTSSHVLTFGINTKIVQIGSFSDLIDFEFNSSFAGELFLGIVLQLDMFINYTKFIPKIRITDFLMTSFVFIDDGWDIQCGYNVYRYTHIYPQSITFVPFTYYEGLTIDIQLSSPNKKINFAFLVIDGLSVHFTSNWDRYELENYPAIITGSKNYLTSVFLTNTTTLIPIEFDQRKAPLEYIGNYKIRFYALGLYNGDDDETVLDVRIMGNFYNLGKVYFESYYVESKLNIVFDNLATFGATFSYSANERITTSFKNGIKIVGDVTISNRFTNLINQTLLKNSSNRAKNSFFYSYLFPLFDGNRILSVFKALKSFFTFKMQLNSFINGKSASIEPGIEENTECLNIITQNSLVSIKEIIVSGNSKVTLDDNKTAETAFSVTSNCDSINLSTFEGELKSISYSLIDCKDKFLQTNENNDFYVGKRQALLTAKKTAEEISNLVSFEGNKMTMEFQNTKLTFAISADMKIKNTEFSANIDDLSGFIERHSEFFDQSEVFLTVVSEETTKKKNKTILIVSVVMSLIAVSIIVFVVVFFAIKKSKRKKIAEDGT